MLLVVHLATTRSVPAFGIHVLPFNMSTEILETKTVTVADGVLIEVPSQHTELRNESLRHPLGVRPAGNALTSSHNLQPAMGLFGRLPDTLVSLLFEYFDQQSLTVIGQTCRGLFAYSTNDQLWRDAVIDLQLADFEWRGSWRASLRKLKSAGLPDVDCSNLFSDSLHRPFLCSQVPLHHFVANIPAQNAIHRLPSLSAAEFDAEWSNRPFILTEPVKEWKVYKQWSEGQLFQRFGDTIFRAEAVDWPLRTYLKYMNENADESPLYLFDCRFAEKMDLKVGYDGDYQPPICFQEDLFTILAEERPDHRWLIVGPKRSGSTFHKDPNATSAWNAVIRGSKYWIMFPQSVLPPGVFISEDQSEVTSPLSIAEWLLTFHEEARRFPGCVEAVCREGEVLHVPSGWFHLVVNLEPAIAITQNFVPRAHLKSVVHFLKYKNDQVSGFKQGVESPWSLFDSRLKLNHPELAALLEGEPTRKRKWEDVVGVEDAADQDGGCFSFGFGDDIEDDQ